MRAATRKVLTPAKVFGFLLGTWRLEGEVTGQAEMVGELEVARSGVGEAEYCERVAVRTTEGAAFSASQRYVVRELADGFTLCFVETGAVFQEVRFGCEEGELRAEVVHVCGEDRYASTYVLGPGREFSVRHVVRGPRKDYVSVTRFCEE